MNYFSNIVQDKIDYIDLLLNKIENNETVSVVDILKDELNKLKTQVEEIKKNSEDKLVIGKEDKAGKSRYFLKDGSVYVVKGREYKYLYDSKTKMVTYVFENGQIERTFENGIKEIRRADGSIIVKTGMKEFDYLTNKY